MEPAQTLRDETDSKRPDHAIARSNTSAATGPRLLKAVHHSPTPHSALRSRYSRHRRRRGGWRYLYPLTSFDFDRAMMRHEANGTVGSFPSAASFHDILTRLQWYAKFSPESRTGSFSNHNLSGRVEHSHTFIGGRLRWRVAPCGNHVAVDSGIRV